MYTWKQVGIELYEDEGLGEQGNILLCKCPKCNAKKKNKNKNTLLVNKKDSTWFCKHCGWNGTLMIGEKVNNSAILNYNNPFIKQYQNNLKLTDNVIEKFKQKKISNNILSQLDIGQNKIYFPAYEAEVMSIIFPYFMDKKLVNLVYFHNESRHSEFGGMKICYGYDDIDEEETYVVADEFEKMTFMQAGINNCIALFGEKQEIENINKNLDFLINIENKLNKVKKFIIALPNTDYGKALNGELVRRLGKAKCWAVFPPEENYNWSMVFTEYSDEVFKNLLSEAKPIPVRGIFDIGDVDDAFEDLYLNGLRKGAKTGYEELDPFYTVIPGQWTLVTGIPGHGKSNLLDSLLVNLATNEDWCFGIFSPENQPIQRHFANIMEKKLFKSFSAGYGPRITEEEKNLNKAWISKHFSVILPDEDDNWSIDGILELAKVLVYRKGIKGLVIDPWNEIDHSRKSNKSETEYISECLTKVRHFARNYDVHVWVVAHPTKMSKDQHGRYLVPTPYDVSGSSHFRNKADNALSVWRNADGKDYDIVDIYIQKIRFKEVGRIGLVSMRYDNRIGKFFEDVDQLKRSKCIESGDHQETVNYLKKVIKPVNTGMNFASGKYSTSDFDDLESF